MNFLKRLFGGAAAPAEEFSVETYEGFTITPRPISEGGQFRLGAVIEKGEQTHELIRADVFRDRDSAAEASIAKAKQVIDEQGEGLFR
ncbi:HlyU family transcriptional regulator [Jannaschia aquimarina]|uniref:Transcriptional activator HlyU n=1 Tax=Jannaschia aquimarina TaxID=935700 RepID=A0A0D1CP51_9RHOB|nr:HlyU family transcriptional regulator [Jannaschia aquimarina]KIT16547.1 Transcriptional activator HlyU [Jannaschia aquimarina]SNT05985.1 hypothetical protein SAMN05421775_10569 [Jannaschia aquimarina]